MEYLTLSQAKDTLLSEGLVVIPTETVYGLAGLATSKKAIHKIFQYKHRPSDNPLICHFSSINQIQEYVLPMHENILKLLEHFTPGPLTVLLPTLDNRLSPALCGQQVVGCRIPNDQKTRELIEIIGIPLAAPSANPSGMPSATTAQMAYEYFQEYPGGIIESDQSVIGLESTIIKYIDNTIFILREGAIGQKEIHQILPDIPVIIQTSNHTQTIPGAKYRHYSPNTPIYHRDTLHNITPQSAIITTKDTILPPIQKTTVVYIAESANPETIAHNLYQTLIAIDSLSVNQAYWYIPNLESESSIGKALKNRLSKVLIQN